MDSASKSAQGCWFRTSCRNDMPCEQVKEMGHINGEFSYTDVSLVIGANHVTNTDAQQAPTEPACGHAGW